MTQGSAFRATLGFRTESRWDSRRVEFEPPHLSSNGAKSISTSSFPETPTYFFSASSANSNNPFVGGSSGRPRSSLSLLWLVSSRSFQMKFHKVEGFALCQRDLVAVASGQAVFGVGNLMKLKGNAVLHEFLRHQL